MKLQHKLALYDVEKDDWREVQLLEQVLRVCVVVCVWMWLCVVVCVCVCVVVCVVCVCVCVRVQILYKLGLYDVEKDTDVRFNCSSRVKKQNSRDSRTHT